MSKVGTKGTKRRVQVSLGPELASQVQALSRSWGVPESAVGAVLIAAGLRRFEEVMGQPLEPRDLAEAVRLARAEELPEDHRPGFRPGGKPRADEELVTASSIMPRGEEWTGYMRGL
jgi:hypothetical protein